MIRIYAVDDYNSFLDSLVSYFKLHADFELIGTYSNLAKTNEKGFENENEEELLDNIESYKPDIVLMDISFTLVGRPKNYGIELTRKIRERRPEQKVIMLAEDIDGNEEQFGLIHDAFRAGATSYLSKGDTESWLDSIKETYDSDKGTITPNVIQAIINQWKGKENYGLTEREIEAIYCLSGDMRIREIGKTMSIGYDGANFHIKNARIKLNVKTNQGLVAAAFRKGVIR